MEVQTKPKIKLSIVAAKYIWPMWVDPITDMQNQFASKILNNMLGKNNGHGR
jgi:hypothetical protein